MKQLVRGRAFRRPPLAEFGDDTCYLAGDAEGCHVGEAWLGRAAARGRVALARAGASQGIHTKPEKSIEDPKRHGDVSVLLIGVHCNQDLLWCAKIVLYMDL